MRLERSSLQELADIPLIYATQKAVRGYRSGRRYKEEAAAAIRKMDFARGVILWKSGRALTDKYKEPAIDLFKALKAVDPEGAEWVLYDDGLKRGFFVAFKRDRSKNK